MGSSTISASLKPLVKAAQKAQRRSRPRLPKQHLPQITIDLIEECFSTAEQISLTDPWRAWSLCYLVAKAARQQNADAFVQGRAAWNLGWAANQCLEPRLVEPAIREAQRFFKHLGDQGWLAACIWQLHAVPYTNSNFVSAKEGLEKALAGLRENEMGAFISPCIQSLAFANLLINSATTLDQADKLILEAEKSYISAGNSVGVARTRRQRAALLTKRSKYPEVISNLTELLLEFSKLDAQIDLAKVRYQLALNYSTMGSPIKEARALYEQVIATYQSAKMWLPEAEAQYGLGMLFIQQGAYERAEQRLSQARKTLERYAIPGLLADFLIDRGRLERIRGNYPRALTLFKHSLQISKKNGARLPEAVARTNVGHAYANVGNLQSALVQLEEAGRDLEEMKNPGRLADSWLYLADTWIKLGQFTNALNLLEAIQASIPSNLKALRFEAGLAKAHCLIGSQHYSQARDFIFSEMDRYRDSETKTDIPLLRRALGLAQFFEGSTDAEATLRTARAEFKHLGLKQEEASCLVALGRIYESSGIDQKALSSWQLALSKSAEGTPEIRIACYIGMASIYEKNSGASKALSLFQQATELIHETTSDFWQPSIFSFQIAKLSPDLEKVLSFYVSHNLENETIEFVEKIKAHTFKQRLIYKADHTEREQAEVRELGRSIDLVQKGSDPQRGGRDWLTQIIKQTALAQLADSVEKRVDVLERKSGYRTTKALPFNVGEFQAMANRRLGSNWVGLDYFMTDHEIVLVMVTATQYLIRSSELTPRLKIALSKVKPQKAGSKESRRDLEILFHELIPPELFTQQHNEKRVLIISPHKTLWPIPWAGLPVTNNSINLVDVFDITLTPSLESLMMLWERKVPRDNQQMIGGAFIGLSDFKGRQIDLPLVQRELEFLRGLGLFDVKQLLNKQATRENIKNFLQRETNQGNQELDFVHLATHIHYDPSSSLLCHIELEDGSYWSEDLLDSVHLPGLVYLSACNGISNFSNKGGEQTGLPLSLLSNGANTVVGSWSAVSDNAALRFTTSFYEELLCHHYSIAGALAKAQQKVRGEGYCFSDWAYMSCMGAPHWGNCQTPL